MSIETIQQNMKTVLDVIKGYYDLVGVRNLTEDKKKLKKIDKELDRKRNYLLDLLKKAKDSIQEEKKHVQS